MSPLYKDVRLLSLDAGNTVIYLDHARVAALVQIPAITTEALRTAEGRAKARAETSSLVCVPFKGDDVPGAKSWGGMVGTMLVEANFPLEALSAELSALWIAHGERNLWSLVPDGLIESLTKVRSAGIETVIVSNSEGKLIELFTSLGIVHLFDRIVDSGVVGVEKPDPAIFELGRGSFPKEQVLHLGDVYATDIVGATRAGIRSALIDPYGHYTGRFPEVPRVDSVMAACNELLPHGAHS